LPLGFYFPKQKLSKKEQMKAKKIPAKFPHLFGFLFSQKREGRRKPKRGGKMVETAFKRDRERD